MLASLPCRYMVAVARAKGMRLPLGLSTERGAVQYLCAVCSLVQFM